MTKLYKDCKHFYDEESSGTIWCKRPLKSIPDLVVGGNKYQSLTPYTERYEGECGIKGKYWERKTK